jgi:hypothetical protein
MKLLFIDAYHHYLNPTSTLLPILVATASPEVSYYGPGYSSEMELQEGIQKFVDHTGPYDGVVLGMHVPLFTSGDEGLLVRNAGNVQRYTSFGSKPHTLLPFFRDVIQNIGALPIRFRFISLLNFDYYATTSRHIDVFERLDAHLIAPGAEFAPSVSELPSWVWEEKHFIRKKGMISSSWLDYLTQRPERIISLTHFIADDEFSFRGLSERKHRVSIPGIEYLMRKKGREALKKSGLRPGTKPIFNVMRYADRLGIRVFAKYLTLKMYHAAYHGNLIDTRFAYTAREGFGIPVRKFFEIPAAGALMMCLPPHGFSALGFRNGESYVEVDPESLPDALLDLEKDPVRSQAIATAGRSLVLHQHTLSARASQFGECLKAISDNTFGGSFWRDGGFHLRDSANAASPSPEPRTAKVHS